MTIAAIDAPIIVMAYARANATNPRPGSNARASANVAAAQVALRTRASRTCPMALSGLTSGLVRLAPDQWIDNKYSAGSAGSHLSENTRWISQGARATMPRCNGVAVMA